MSIPISSHFGTPVAFSHKYDMKNVGAVGFIGRNLFSVSKSNARVEPRCGTLVSGAMAIRRTIMFLLVFLEFFFKRK